jgi:hypothetical protein
MRTDERGQQARVAVEGWIHAQHGRIFEEADSARREEWLQANRHAREVIGESPREQLRWLLDAFAYEDLSGNSTDELRRIWELLDTLVHESTSGEWTLQSEIEPVETITSNTADKEKAAKLPPHLRRVLNIARDADISNAPPVDGTVSSVRIDLVRYRAPLDELQEAQLTVRQAVAALHDDWEAHRYARDLRSVTVSMGRRDVGWRFRFAAPLNDALIVAVLKLLGEIPMALVRRCDYPPGPRAWRRPGPEPDHCKRVFVAKKRQKYCESHRQLVRREQLRAAQLRHRVELKRPRVGKQPKGQQDAPQRTKRPVRKRTGLKDEGRNQS